MLSVEFVIQGRSLMRLIIAGLCFSLFFACPANAENSEGDNLPQKYISLSTGTFPAGYKTDQQYEPHKKHPLRNSGAD